MDCISRTRRHDFYSASRGEAESLKNLRFNCRNTRARVNKCANSARDWNRLILSNESSPTSFAYAYSSVDDWTTNVDSHREVRQFKTPCDEGRRVVA
jgi:hypothetical protein